MTQVFDHIKEVLWNKIDFNQCQPSQSDYTWFMLRFVMNHDDVKAMQSHEAQFRKEFRETLDISALRLAKMVISFGHEEIQVRVKLAQPDEPTKYFRLANDVKLFKSTIGMITASLSHCLLICLQREKSCVAAYFNAQNICELLIDEEQAKLALQDSAYRVKTDLRAEVFGKVYVRNYFGTIGPSEFEGASNRRFLKELQRRVDDGKFAFYIFVSVESLKELRPTQLLLNSGDGKTIGKTSF